MLELPETRVIADQIRQQLCGRRIRRVTAAHSPHKFAWFIGDPQEYGAQLETLPIDDAVAHGGHIEMHLGNMRLVFHDGTRLRYHPPGGKLPDKHQLLVELDDDSAFSCSVQMYGGIYCFKHGAQINSYYHAAIERISPYQKAFDQAYFDHLVRAALDSNPKLSVKGLLATQQRIPGLGNGVFQDIALKAGLNPKRKATALGDAQLDKLYHSLQQVLHQMALQGGRNTETDLWGARGGYQTQLCSKTSGKPCPVCASDIIKEAYMGGSIYYCPQCQPVNG